MRDETPAEVLAWLEAKARLEDTERDIERYERSLGLAQAALDPARKKEAEAWAAVLKLRPKA